MKKQFIQGLLTGMSAGLVGATAIVFLLLNPHPVASISSASSCSLRAL